MSHWIWFIPYFSSFFSFNRLLVHLFFFYLYPINVHTNVFSAKQDCQFSAFWYTCHKLSYSLGMETQAQTLLEILVKDCVTSPVISRQGQAHACCHALPFHVVSTWITCPQIHSLLTCSQHWPHVQNYRKLIWIYQALGNPGDKCSNHQYRLKTFWPSSISHPFSLC